MATKFKMEWTNVQGDLCVLNFIVDDDYWSDAPVTIYGGPRPFVLSEFNQDNDIFKPIRPQQATIEILASINGVDLEDFIIEDDDRQMIVRFDFGSYTGYWYGIISQEDMQELWIAQNHILTLRADEGFGTMKTIPLQDGTGQILAGTYTPFALIQYASTETVQTFFNCYVFSGLFHDSMTTGNTQTGIDQCTIDARTFETSPGVFEDSYTVLEKINSAFNQTIFQWQGQWVILRIEELFVDKTTNIRGFQNNKPTGGSRGTINTRYTIKVGVNEDVKPVMPEMIKTLNKPSKQTTVSWDWDEKAQIVCNEKFKYGTFVETTGTPPNETWKYTVDNWTLQKGNNPGNTTAASETFQRHVVYNANGVDDEYIIIGKNATQNVWARSCDVYVKKDDEMNFTLQWSLKSNATVTVSRAIGYVLLYGADGTYYTLDEDGVFYQSNATWTTNVKLLNVSFINGEGADWKDFDITANIPKSGYLQILLLSDTTSEKSAIYYRNLNVSIQPAINKFRRQKIAGDFNRYTIDKTIKKNSDTKIYLDDSFSPNFKGAIFEADGLTLTDNNWFRRRYSSERYRFKRQNAIANWWINRQHRMRLECNFFGLKWDRSGTKFPIGLINTINFVDDAPDKTFAIVNLKEIDFMSCVWSANLLEVWDEDTDTTVEPGATDVHLNDYYYE
ncbi:hypothetical protein EBZ39_06790 [bacterium]|nr:hypothetical protein [bacterium]